MKCRSRSSSALALVAIAAGIAATPLQFPVMDFPLIQRKNPTEPVPAAMSLEAAASAYCRSPSTLEAPPQPAEAPLVERLTFDGNLKQHPAWSPDGQLIAFTVYSKGKVGLVQMKPGSTEWKHITPFDEYPEYEPTWSLDGKHILFVHVSLSGTDGQLEIHAMNADGSESKRLVTPAKRPAQDEHPAWSPDGKQIAFTSTRDGNQEIYLCDADGGNLRRITSHPNSDSHPTWSPDGRQIAFCSSRFGNMEICLMHADGSEVRRLTNHPAMDYQPKWSPDGSYIAFTSTRDGNYEIYLIRPDGTGLRNLTQNPAVDKDPTWNPDSSQVMMMSNRDGKSDLYSVPVRER